MTQSTPLEASLASRSPPVVLLTGWGSTARVFDGLIASFVHDGGDGEPRARQQTRARLPEFAVRAAMLDMSGAPQDNDPESVLEWALEALTRDVPPGAVLVGWSLGGALALRFAARHPGRLAAVVSIATSPCFCARPDWDAGMPIADFEAFRVAYLADAQAHLSRFTALQASGDAAAAAVRRVLRGALPDGEQGRRFGPALDVLSALDVRDDLARIDVPMLHVLGEKDPLVPVAVAERLQALSPAGSVWVASGASHAPFLSRPHAFEARLRDFIASLSPPVRRTRGVARTFGRAAERYDTAAALQRDCASDLLARAPEMRVARVLDLGCGTGAMLPALQVRFAGAELLAVDIAPPMLQVARARAPHVDGIAADAEQLPLCDASVDLVFSSLALQWCVEIERACREIARVLRPGGIALLALPGPATLWELRAAWHAVDGRDHVNRFLPMSLLLAAACKAGLEIRRAERGERVERHADARSVVRGLRAIGANTLDGDRRAGLGGREAWTRLDRHYASLGDGADGLPATWELLYLSLEKPHAA